MTGRMDGKDDHQGYYISSSSEGAQGKGKEGMKLSLWYIEGFGFLVEDVFFEDYIFCMVKYLNEFS